MIPLFKPYMPSSIWDDSEFKELLYSGKLINGRYKMLFRDELSRFVGNKNIVLCASFFDAQSIVIRVLNLKPEDEVIVSPLACLRSTVVYKLYGINVVWADIDPMTGTLDPSDVERKITKRTKAIIHNQHLGYTGYIDEINAIGEKYDVSVIDDCLDGIGGSYKGNAIGNCGTDLTIASFDPVRLPNTISGACIITKDTVLYERCRFASDLYIDRKKFRLEDGRINPDCDIAEAGVSSPFSELNAFIGVRQMADLEILLSKRSKNAAYWDAFFENNTHLKCIPLKNRDAVANYWVYGFKADKKDEVFSHCHNKGFEVSDIHFPNHRYSVFNNKPFLSGVEEFYRTFLAVPCGWWVEENDI